jgi:hypothetical protein
MERVEVRIVDEYHIVESSITYLRMKQMPCGDNTPPNRTGSQQHRSAELPTLLVVLLYNHGELRYLDFFFFVE